MRAMSAMVCISSLSIIRIILPLRRLFHVLMFLCAAVPGMYQTNVTVCSNSSFCIASISSVGCRPLMGMYSVMVGS